MESVPDNFGQDKSLDFNRHDHRRPAVISLRDLIYDFD